jgi:hypothetical protein
MSLRYKLLFFAIIIFCFGEKALSQETARVVGTVSDSVSGEVQAFVSVVVVVDNQQRSVVKTDEQGRYDISVPADMKFDLVFMATGFPSRTVKDMRLKPNDVIRLNILLSDLMTVEVLITTFEEKEADALRIKGDDIKNLPTTTMNLESMLQFMAVGVTAGPGGELTSQYSVRGGNYDENLVYVNGFEIYRPLLIRSGQQEGLTFPNPDMLDALSFSSGAFKAQYGDKMSSVLDVRYRRPTERFEGRVTGSLLGASVYLGGAKYLKNSNSRRFTYTLGARYKTTKYILNSLDIKGEYVPNFVDVQGDFIYDLSSRWQVELIGGYNSAQFTLVPLSSATTTGLFNQAIRLSSLFEGKEISDFNTNFVGTSATYAQPVQKIELEDKKISIQNSVRHRFMLSAYQSRENERIDIQNFYRLEEVETGLGEDNFGEVVGTLAYGETHQFARNYLRSNVLQAQYVGALNHERSNTPKGFDNNHLLQWGATYKYEYIYDRLKEWTRFDSLGFTLPFDTTMLVINDYLNTDTILGSHRLAGFVQNTWEFKNEAHFLRLTAGVRAQYWTINKELVISPRVQIYYTPMRFHNLLSDTTKKTKDLTFKLACGAYHQPPFYRELRDFRGNINSGVLAQKSIHALGGVVWDFMMFKRRFKFISEAYYKHQWDLIPYDVENVRVRYYGDNMAKGYVGGIDFRLNGELVPGMESWVNLSFLRARESFDSVQHKIYRLVGTQIDTILTPDVPKPTDQLFIFSMYFQDYFPGAEWFQVNLALTVGAGMPFGIPRDNVVARNLYRYPAYHRIDCGFSFGLWNRDKYVKKHFADENKVSMPEAYDEYRKKKHAMKYLRNVWLSAEVFNLMAVANVASNTWIKDFTNTSYAIPNYLTSRRINVRLRVEF